MLAKLKTKKHNKKLLILLCAAFLLAMFFLPLSPRSAHADDGSANSAEQDLTKSIDDILQELNLESLEAYIASLSPNQLSIFGGANAHEKIRSIVSGGVSLNYGNFFQYLFELIGIDLFAFLPVMLAILTIAIAMNILHSSKARLAQGSTGDVISFAGTALTAAILAAQIFMLVSAVRRFIVAMQTQMNIVFPIILTLMAASGGVVSAGVYRPAVAILASGIMELIVLAVLPMFILSAVFTVVGNLSETVRLKKMSGFFMKTCKWLLATAFFLFLAFLSVQGITASVHDGVSVRTARFAISKYVPIIGGHLSDGFNLIMAGSTLVKNAVGMTAVVLLVLSVLPIVSQVAVFNLSLHLTGAVVEPLGDKKVSNILSELAKNSGTLIAVLLGAAFLYFLFLMLAIITGNPSL
ncbi:MAG: stage III sporulation protein AE [Firmicutes bacterium]|nr:stage III sporulation protein AE [Bacillota bacterium]